MDYMQIAESPLLYFLVGVVGIGSVLIIAIVFLKKSWKRAKQIGFSHEELVNVVKSSLSFSFVPSIAIVIGFFGLAAMLGVPWPWYRLSVVGSVAYEIMAANLALGSLGKELVTATATDFTLIMYVMSVSVTGGLITILFLGKRLQEGTMKLKEKDSRWGALGNSCFMLTIVIVMLIPMIIEGGVTLLTLLTSAIVALILSLLVRKGVTWLNNFILAICLIVAMASSVLWTYLLA